MTNAEYSKLADKMSPKSPLVKNMTMAYLVGGLICAAGQGLKNVFGAMGMSEEHTAMVVPVTLIFLGALITGLHFFDNIAKTAGAGTLVPITGFANAIVSPAMEFKSEGFILGVGGKMFVISGPVIVYGVASSIICGFIHYLLAGRM